MNSSQAQENILDKISDCVIDQDGIFKYIQILVKSNNTKESKYVVRGYSKYDYHAKNYSDFQREITSLGVSKDVTARCTGGGRIEIDKNKKSIFVYGYSQAYGQCDHQKSCDIIKKSFPYHDITWSNEGY